MRAVRSSATPCTTATIAQGLLGRLCDRRADHRIAAITIEPEAVLQTVDQLVAISRPAARAEINGAGNEHAQKRARLSPIGSVQRIGGAACA